MRLEVEAQRGARYLMPRTQYLAPPTLLFSQWVYFLERHSTQTGRSLENLARIFSTNDPYKCSSQSDLLHVVHTPPFPTLKNALHLSHCQLNADWRKNGGTYTIARV